VQVSRLLLVRHGQSTWNAAGRWQGQADPPLSDLGVEQARSAARAIEQIDRAWSSDLVRAHRTAAILAERHELPVQPDARVRERAAGPWTGLTRDEIEAQYPGALAARQRPPGFEGDDALGARALGALREFADAVRGGTGLVVTHGGVILTIERHLELEPEPVANLAGRWLEIAGDRVQAGPRVLLVDPDEVAVTHPAQP